MALSADQLEQELDALCAAAFRELAEGADAPAVDAVRVKYLGRKGMLTQHFTILKDPVFPASDKARAGKKLNEIKTKLEAALGAASGGTRTQAPSAAVDWTLPGIAPAAGRLHPLTQTIDEILSIFRSLGFAVVEGPEIETEHNNFEALNIPDDHPSRESFDTYYLREAEGSKQEAGDRWLLRSHTSPVQIRFMQTHKPPLQIVVPGRVFRRDAVDATHCFQFHQVEGLAVGRGITFGDLRGTLNAWARLTFGEAARLRFRPHFFPFTEPSAEVDLSCIFCDGKGCRVCGHNGWLEIMGCGMVHPNVFKAVGYPVGSVGFAFGMGVERIAMLKYGIEDIRYFFEPLHFQPGHCQTIGQRLRMQRNLNVLFKP